MIEENMIKPDESLKLIKNSKGYHWEIRLHSERLSDEDLKRLEGLNSQLKITYPKREVSIKQK